jgi:hypothetical protein
MPVIINPNTGVITNTNVVYDGIQSGSVVQASGTETTITGIPSWAKRITLMVSDVSTTSTNGVHVRVGDLSGIFSTGYTSAVGSIRGSNITSTSTSSGLFYLVENADASDSMYGVITLYNITGNTWVSYSVGSSNNIRARIATGSITLSASLDKIQILADPDTFDAGIVNIFYE